MKRIHIIGLILLTLLSNCLLAAEIKFIHPTLKSGDHSVGYSRLSINDFATHAETRFDYQGTQVSNRHYRTIPISFWYPAKRSKKKAITLRQYVNYFAPGKANGEILDKDRVEAIRNFKQYPMQNGASDEVLETLLNTSMGAQENAEPSEGQYPLILIPGGFYAAFFVTPIAEYYASHGYTVAYINDSASAGIAGYENNKDILWRLSDLKLAINRLQKEPSVSWNNIGIWAYHSGGSVGTLLQMQSQNVRGLISVEGSEAWTRESLGYPLLSKMSLYSPDRVKVPYMRFQSLREEPDWYISTPAKTTWEFYDNIQYADVYRVLFNDSDHDGLGARIRDSVMPDKKDIENVELQLILGYSLNFFDFTLKQNTASSDYLSKQPAEHGFSKELAKIEFSKGRSAPPLKSDLKRAFLKGGVEAIKKMSINANKIEKGVVDARLIGALGQDYYFAEKNPQAAFQIIDIATQMFKDDYWGPYLAGVFYGRMNDNEKMKAAFVIARKRLESDSITAKDRKESALKRIDKALSE